MTLARGPHTFGRMSFLLPQDRFARVQRMQSVDIHGDRYVDLALLYEGDESEGARMARVPRSECPEGLAEGVRVSVRIVVGVVTRLSLTA